MTVIEACPWCSGVPGTEFQAREMMFGLRHTFTYARCVDCGSLWLRDVPVDLTPYYERQYYSMSPDEKGATPSLAATAWGRLILHLPTPFATRLAGRRGFPPYLLWFAGLAVNQGMRVADIGSGEGGMVSRLARHGFTDVWGFDPFIEADRDDGNAHYRRRGISAADGQFDLILFNHSLEHVPEPRDALRDALTALAPSGTVIVRIPLAGSFADRTYGGNWASLDPPRHLAIPSRAGMRRATADAGLQIARIFYDSEPFQIWASENYRRDIPLIEETAITQLDKQLRARAAALNHAGDGDYAGFVLTR